MTSRRCVLCETCEESISHLFFMCKIANKIWKMSDMWIRVLSVHHKIVNYHFLGFELMGLSRIRNHVRRMVWVTGIYGLIETIYFLGI